MTTAAMSRRTPRSRRPSWLVPAGLLLLCVVPVAAGIGRLVQLARGAAITPENARFFHSPVPVVVHVIGASLFLVLGVAQFVPSLRRRHRRLHRITGRLLVPAGLAAALSGLWMSFFYALPATDNQILQGLRVLFGVGMIVSLVLGVRAAMRREFAQHSAWMARGYAIGMGAGTQVLTSLPWILLVGPLTGPSKDVTMAAGWLINLAVAECAVRGIRPWRRSTWATARPR